MTVDIEWLDKKLRAALAAYWVPVPEPWDEILEIWQDAVGKFPEFRVQDAIRRVASSAHDYTEITPGRVRFSIQTSGGLTIERVIEATEIVTGVRKADLISPRRSIIIARPRMAAMYVAATRTKHSLPVIGRAFGGRDHTTVLHARRKIEDLLKVDPDVSEMVGKIADNVCCESRMH